ncbi:MAG: hypothetical protein IT572_10320 [Deltaproteobacteria bacterium]|nr:hypothetical protein [Deltaproteobacteria bacterium]
MRKFAYSIVFTLVFGITLAEASAQLRSTYDSKTLLTIYSQVLAPTTKTGTVSGQDPQMLQGQDPQMLQGQDPQMLQGQDPQMYKYSPYIYMGQDPQM